MSDYTLNIEFLGTGGTFNSYRGYKKYNSDKHIGFADEGDIKNLCFDGPNLLNIGQTSTSNTYKKAIKLIPEIINRLDPDNPENEIQVNFSGHSRGGAVCSKVYKKIYSQYKDNHNIKFTMKISDPYAGPTASGEDTLTRLNKNPNGLTSVVYATKTLFRCTPQQVAGADIVIIVNTGHNSSSLALGRNAPQKKGLYLAYCKDENSSPYKYTQVQNDPISIKEFFSFIYKYGTYTQTNRWRLFTSILIQKLGLKSYDELEMISKMPKDIMFPNVMKEFKTALNSIIGATNLLSAFDTAFQSGGIFQGMGGKTFHDHLSKAKECVCGISNNEHKDAIQELQAIIKKFGRPAASIKAMVADTLIHKIKKWYNLK